MVKEEASTPTKSEKASSPVQEQNNVHAYPNWAAVQAYYGPGVGLPPQYFNPAVASAHPAHPPHPFMWPQMMSPYGTPYAAMYPPGGVYGHPPFLGPSTQAPANSSCPVASEVMAATPLSMATPTKSSSSSKGQSLLKRLKGANGNAVSNSGSSAASHSEDCRTEGSSAGTDNKSTEKGDQTRKKRNCKEEPSTGNINALSVYGGSSNATSNLAPGLAIVPSGVVPSASGKASKIIEGQSQGALPSAHLTKDERELKRERRKQSNRESARRSRLRKQAEAEELSVKVASLNAENLTLRTEINQLKDNSEKLRIENESLMEKLSNTLPDEGVEMEAESEQEEEHTVNTENFLSRVETSLSNNRVAQTEIETNGNEHSSSGTKLHQLLVSSPRNDPVAAS